ncbi:MAG: transferrin receptor-like dimerization domain-containing protein [candidate division KSB1 bacterium]|nr:transferrin receptor-like dimerization domain-containing protein [candidate division KSB1 bacterium]
MQNKRLRWTATVAMLLCGALALPAQDASIMGFSPSSAKKQLELEKKIIGMPSGERMREYHRALTAEPHHAGTEANVKTAEYIAQKLREFGADRVQYFHYEALLPRPVERRVVLLEPERYELILAEPAIDADPDSKKDGVLPPFNAYAADGEVTAQVVYVNYGIPDDYKVLDSLGISVEGKIVIARYGRSWRGIKPRLAAERGALACILYSDPADDGYRKGDVVPEGKWRPWRGVQRGSVMDMPTYPGDPQTPGYASKKGARRIPLDQVKTLQKIPVLPISYEDALPILRNLRGKAVPESWQGGLPITYHFGPGPAKVSLKLKHDWSVRPIVNVIGYIRGSQFPDEIILVGGHRDAWTFGGRDPISGAVSLLETARAIGELVKQGHRPKRTIAFASWDAEEYGLIGSVEYGEEYARQLRKQIVVYLNRESYTAGDFGAGGSHALQPFINEITKAIYMPGDSVTIFEAWQKKAGKKKTNLLEWQGQRMVRISALGSGSDYTVFLDHLGIPSINLGFSSGNGIYHSRYDSHWFFTTFGDPGFRYGEKLAELVAIFLLRMANADILPFDYAATSETIDRYLDELDKELEKKNWQNNIDFAPLRKRNHSLFYAARVLNDEIQRILISEQTQQKKHRKKLQRLNQLLYRTEQQFLHEAGLPGRPWFKHQIYAPGFYTGYGVKTLPGIREAIEKGDTEEAKHMVRVLEKVLHRAQQSLVQAIRVAAEIR